MPDKAIPRASKFLYGILGCSVDARKAFLKIQLAVTDPGTEVRRAIQVPVTSLILGHTR